ncbi:MAG: hypothetical protein MOB07_23115 [Acidobacteria bacterium]|nr:hypothetical protein [Acidobacteriota bacterium]
MTVETKAKPNSRKDTNLLRNIALTHRRLTILPEFHINEIPEVPLIGLPCQQDALIWVYLFDLGLRDRQAMLQKNPRAAPKWRMFNVN